MVLFGLLWFYSVHLFYFVHSVHFGPMWPTSTSIQSNVVHSVLFCSLLFHLVLFYSLLGFLYFFLLFLGIQTEPRNMFMEREVVRDKVGGIYIMIYIYIYIYIYIVIWFWIKHISRPYLDYETTRENEKKKKNPRTLNLEKDLILMCWRSILFSFTRFWWVKCDV